LTCYYIIFVGYSVNISALWVKQEVKLKDKFLLNQVFIVEIEHKTSAEQFAVRLKFDHSMTL